MRTVLWTLVTLAFLGALAGERRRAGEQLVGGGAERVDVREVNLLGGRLRGGARELRGHLARRADGRAAGAGAVGRSIARELLESNHEVTLLERNPDHIDVDAIPAAHWRLGDACEISVLESVHLEDFDVVIGALPYAGLMIAFTFLLIAWPDLALWLPRSMMGTP